MGNSSTNSKDNDSTSPKHTNKSSPPRSEVDTVKADEGNSLGPPPRPAQTSDYFAYEPNPFEDSFGGGNSTDRSGGPKLPPVAALTSPALPGGTTPNYWGAGSLRTGPLSPAMLSGPTTDYFSDSHHLRGTGFTPNESSLRTGLTPGGGGSMFPDPSPNAAAMYSQLASGGATPSTLDFHRTALSAAAAQKRNAEHQAQQNNITSQPQDLNGMDIKPLPQPAAEIFGQHDANDAANGLFMLASQSRNSSQGVNQYAMAQQQPVHAHPQPPNHGVDMSSSRLNGSTSTASGRGVSEMSGHSEESENNRPNTRGKGKKTAQAQTNGRRKADDTPSKGPASKKSKANNGNAAALSFMEPEPQSDEEIDMKQDEYNANGKKMTDEEKRKNFLERNRVAALKCRQRKKQWLANLQHKVEVFSSENDALSAQISQLREEVVNLKTMLLAHKDCPVTQSQGINGNYMGQILADYGNTLNNPYGMAMTQQVMAGSQGVMQRRFS